ncbi:MAG TPA: mannosyltransferase family protein, partial [Chloroflexota bacterium]
MESKPESLHVPQANPVTTTAALPREESETAATPWSMLYQDLPGDWRLALGLVLALRVGLGLAGFVSVRLQPVTIVGGDWLNLLIHSGRPWSDLLSIWQRWDALWYQQIATHGYHAGDGTVAFQPLYPLLARIVSLPLLGSIVLAELLVSSAAFFGAMWLLYHTALLDTDHSTSRLTVLLTALFPVGFFLLAPYTESLYLLLTLAAFWFARSGRPWLAGFAAMGAGLTRTFGGIFMVLPLAYEYLRRRDERKGAAGDSPPGGLLQSGFGLLASTLPVVGLIALALYQKGIVGEQRSPLALQSYWGNRVVSPLHPVPDSVSHIVHTADMVEVLNLACLLSFAVLALLAVRYLPLTYALYALPYLALMFSRESLLSPLESVARYMLVLFPCMIVLALGLARHPRLTTGW